MILSLVTIKSRIYSNFNFIFLICIFFGSLLLTDYSTQIDNTQESFNLLNRLMRSFGLIKENLKEPTRFSRHVNRLIAPTQDSTNNCTSIFPSGINAKIIDSHEDYVDNNVSNIDGVTDKGSHSNFDNQKTGPDNFYDVLSETDVNTVNQLNLSVDSWDITRNKWAKTGASPYLDNQTIPSVNEVHTVANAVGSKNGDEIGDFGFQDVNLSGTLISVKLSVYGHANPSYPTDAYFSVHLWNGSIWIEIMNFSGEPNFCWKEVDVSTYINTWEKVNGTKIFLRTEDLGGNKYGEQLCDLAILEVNYLPLPNYNIDVELQWTSAIFTKPNAQLAIYTGNLGTEGLRVDVWNGSWIIIIPNLITDSWNNVSIENYLKSSIFTIRFKGTEESSDTTQDQWNIDVTLLHTWDNDITPPTINDFGVDDLGTGVGIFWANISDSQSDVDEVTLQVNSSQYAMVYNGSPSELGFWVKQIAVNFNGYYSYQIINASDSAENYISVPSEIRNHTFNLDTTAPIIENWEYFADIGVNGTFNANITDNWGELDTVIVNVTEIDGIPQNNLWAIMVPTPFGFVNDTLFMDKDQVFNFSIFANDTSGNSFISLKHIGTGPNHPPEATNLSISVNPRTNESLLADWIFNDVDGDGESGSLIRWYKNGVLVPAYNNLKTVPFGATSKGQVWNYTLQVFDGDDYSTLYYSPITTIINTPPEASSVTLTPTPTSSDEIVAGWIASDIDGDNPNNFLNVTIIRWYQWVGTWIEIPEWMNSTYITPDDLTRDEIFRFEIQLFDGEEYSQVYISPNTTILNSLPILTTIPSFNKTTGITTSDNINITYLYNDEDGDVEVVGERIIFWYRNGQFNSTKTNDTILLSSETASGETWQYIIRVYDGFEYSINYTSILISIDSYTNTIPEVQNILLSGNTNSTIETLIASYNFYDADGHQQVEKHIRWYMNGTLQSSLNNSFTVNPSLTVKGQIWNFTIRVFDGLNWSLQYNSSKLTIRNSIPQVNNIQITSNTTTISNLIIDWDFSDLDGDNQERFDLKWYINNIYNSSYDDLTEIDSTQTKKNQNWICSIRIFDGENYSSWFNSSRTFIFNTPPSLQNLGLQGGKNTSQNITLVYNFVDVDNDSEDTENTIINWFFINGSIILGQNTIELANEYFVAGNILYAKITPNDGEDSGTTYQTGYLQIGNAKPTIIGLPNIVGFNDSAIYFAAVSLSVNYTAQDLDHPFFIYDIDVDENGLVVGSNYRWYKNGQIMSDLTGPIVLPFYLSKGDLWMVSVQPKDRYGDLGSWINSSEILIGNTPPEILSFSWTTTSPTVQNDLSFTYTFYDLDFDSEWQNQTKIYWYRNSIEISVARNQSTLSKLLYVKGDSINLSIRLFDGTNYSLLYRSTSVTVVNSIPEAQNIAILPTKPYTYDSLQVKYDFFDYDTDNESSNRIIQWFRNGILVPELTNSSRVNSTYTSSGEVWILHLKVSDSLSYSQEYILPPVIILNSPPRILGISLEGNINSSFADSSLTFNLNEDIIVYDPDQDVIISYSISWLKNFEFQYIYTGQPIIPESELIKGDIWFAIVRVFDGKDWSGNQSSQEILIINKAPEILNLWLINNSYSEFLLENENISLVYDFQDIDDDLDDSIIYWYQNQIFLPEFTNSSQIPAEETFPGDSWYAEILPYDGELFGLKVNLSIYIESQPTINEVGVDINSDKEGHYTFWANVTDPQNPITEVIFRFDFQNNTLEQRKWAEFNGTTWTLDYQLENYSYLGNLVRIEVTAISTVNPLLYSTSFEILTVTMFDYVMNDEVAPRIRNAYFTRDNELDPKFLTFYAEVEEFGFGISQIVIYYYFKPFTEGNGATIADWMSSLMIFQNRNLTDSYELWSLEIDFHHNNSNYEILYYISTSDKTGNEDPLAFDIRAYPQRIIENRFIYKPQGLPEWILLIAAFVIFLIFVGAMVYVRFIRKPEIIGFDRDIVMKNIEKISDTEINASLDLHTLGVILSYFDQRSGPVPLIVIPDLLQDNITPLIALSDRSFNSCGFANDFTSKTFSSFDFSLESLIRISSMSYGYSIANKEARGGAEHYTVNLLIIPEIFPLINQFKEELQTAVHEIHMLMTNEPENKDAILESVINLRKRVSYIVLSYKDVYKTTELIKET